MATSSSNKKFGSKIREWREKKGISLRKFAGRIKISPTYLSKIERGEFDPPSEEKIQAIAEGLGQDPDLLLAMAGKISSDLPEIIQENPKEMATFLRSLKGRSAEEIKRFTEQLGKEDDD